MRLYKTSPAFSAICSASVPFATISSAAAAILIAIPLTPLGVDTAQIPKHSMHWISSVQCVGSIIHLPSKPAAMISGRLIAALAVCMLCVSEAGAQTPAAQRGLNFVRIHCAQCHAIDKSSPSPLRDAPPFRTLHRRYPVESLQEAFAEGIVTGHPSMPEFRLDPGQA